MLVYWLINDYDKKKYIIELLYKIKKIFWNV